MIYKIYEGRFLYILKQGENWREYHYRDGVRETEGQKIKTVKLEPNPEVPKRQVGFIYTSRT